MKEATFSYDDLFFFTLAMFRKIGCPEDHARIATEALLSADLRGIDSHGIARLSGYVRLWEAARVNSKPDIRILHETPSTATLDGDAGLGLVVGQKAIDIAIEKAAAVGTGWVAVQASNHFGIAAYHAMKALPHGMIGIAMTNASALVAPTFSKERMLGTNPICVAVPAGEEPPFVADFATTTAANGKLEILQRKGDLAPGGWIQDRDGQGTHDAHALREGGALLPLGGNREGGSHKGFALGAIVDILSAVLSGANYGPWVPPFPAYVPMPEGQPGRGIGHFIGAMRVDAFRPAAEFYTNMDNWIRRFRTASVIEGQPAVVIPGDPERAAEKGRRANGIPLLPPVVEDLRALAARLGVDGAVFSRVN